MHKSLKIEKTDSHWKTVFIITFLGGASALVVNYNPPEHQEFDTSTLTWALYFFEYSGSNGLQI